MAPSDEERLSQLRTRWSLLAQAHRADDPHAARDAQAELLPRYCAAVYRYVRGAVADAAAADDLCQEFALRFVRGDFRHARPDKGRFRDYLKTALFHLVGEARRRPGQRWAPLDSRAAALAVDDPERGFREAWRRELLNAAWAALEREGDGPRPTAYDVLRRKADATAETSAALAAKLSEEFGRPLTAEAVRQATHRARARFAVLLRAEVAATLPGFDAAAVDAELAELGLLTYCRPVAR